MSSGADSEPGGPGGPGGGGGGGGGSSSTSGMSRSSTNTVHSSRRQVFLELVRQSNVACQSGDFSSAVTLYSEALKIDPSNHILFSNRSAAFIKMGQFGRALQDALKAKELNPKWPKAYYRQGVALQCLGKHPDALAAFSAGLAEDPKSGQLLAGLVEAASKSPLKGKLSPTFSQLASMKLAKSPFVVISVIGQELLAGGSFTAAVVVLEAALKIGTANLKLKGSVYSALSSAYWALNSLDKAIYWMREDLAAAKSLGDVSGECRAHGNLGSAYFSQSNYKDALTSHRYQLVLAMKAKDTGAAASALTSLGHVYTAIGDLSNALASHKQCVQLLKQLPDPLAEAREIGNVGSVYLVLGDTASAISCASEHLRLAKTLGSRIEEARALSALGSAHHAARSFDLAIEYHTSVLRLATEVLHERGVEGRAYAGLGAAARAMGNLTLAKEYHGKQLDAALGARDKVGESRACSNLGIVFQLMGDHDAALKLHQAHLAIALSLGDRAGAGRAYGNIGNAYSALGYFEEAIKYHKQELAISKAVSDRGSEGATHGNLGVACQALGWMEKALSHYQAHLGIARELKDSAGEAVALLNLGHCHSAAGEFRSAIPYYESYLMLSQELGDAEGEGKACHFLGYAHFSLGGWREAVRYYDQDLVLAKELGQKSAVARAYCNLGLSHGALGNWETALECQKGFLAVAHSAKDVQGKYRALGNLANVLLKLGKGEEAVGVLNKQLMVAKATGERSLEAGAYGALGAAHKMLKRFDLAVGFHTQELTILQETGGDAKGECRAHGSLGGVHMALGKYSSAFKCYEEMLERAKDSGDVCLEAQAYANLGIARMNTGSYEEAAAFFSHQLSLLEVEANSSTSTSKKKSGGTSVERSRAYRHLGECHSALGDHQSALAAYEKATDGGETQSLLRALGRSSRALGMLTSALTYFEKRVRLLEEENVEGDKAEALHDVGETLLLSGRRADEALRCFEDSLRLSRREETSTLGGEAESHWWMGKAHFALGEMDAALASHTESLRLATEGGDKKGASRATAALGKTHEALGNLEQALVFLERFLSEKTEGGGVSLEKVSAYSAIGRIHHNLGNTIQAVAYLTQGLQLLDAIGPPTSKAREEEAVLRYFLGLAFWTHGNLESAHGHLETATDLLETIRQGPGDASYSLALFDRQLSAYAALQRLLVLLGRSDLALLFAEKSRTLSHSTLLPPSAPAVVSSSLINSLDGLLTRVNRHNAPVLYFSIASGFLYAWLLIPLRGIVKFHETCIEEEEEEEEEAEGGEKQTILDKYVASSREALGVDGGDVDVVSENLSSASSLWSLHLEELGERLNGEGFLRLAGRNHRFNCSSYSLSSLFSVGSAGGGSVKSAPALPSAGTTSTAVCSTSSALHSLYALLLQPFEEDLAVLDKTCLRELVLVLPPPLLLAPFPLLRPSPSAPFLCAAFKLLVAPSLSALRSSALRPPKGLPRSSPPPALVLGDPSLPPSLAQAWGFPEIPRSRGEASLVSNLLAVSPLVGTAATKAAVLQALPSAHVVHFATHVSWKLGGVVVAPPTEASDGDSSPGLSTFLLTASELLHARLSNVKLVVLSSCQSREAGLPSPESLVALTRALLAGGASAVLVTLWPVPETASKIFFRALYSSLLQGSRASHAVAEAMMTVQGTKAFGHPGFWAGYVLLGSDVQLVAPAAATGPALAELMRSPERWRDALRVCLHLVEKSLQRIAGGQKNAMYTTQKSIENKVGGGLGGGVGAPWRDVLVSVGFRFEGAANGLPAAVFFPQSDPGERLVKASAALQALLGLSPQSLNALSKLLSTPEAGQDVISILRVAIAEMAGSRREEDQKVEVKINVKLWGVVGCHELLASLGFDLVEVGENEVILGVGKHVTLRMLQLALQAAIAIFESQCLSSGGGEMGGVSGSEQSPPGGGGGCAQTSFNTRSLSLESLELGTEELVPPSGPPAPPPSFALIPPPFAMGKGAFTSYVRSRGEPDGHTNTPPSRPPPTYQNVQRADSSSSSTSEWDNGSGLSTVRRRVASQAPPPPSVAPLPPKKKPGRAIPLSKRVTWKSQGGGEVKPWMTSSASPSDVHPTPDVLLSGRTTTTTKRDGGGDALDVFPERNVSTLGLAPSLSKLLLSSPPSNCGEEGAASAFDALSLHATDDDDDHVAVDEAERKSKVNSKQPPKGSGPFVTTAEISPISLSVGELGGGGGDASSSSASSSKSSPSDLTRRDEGDGRSLTDSQYGSYSPSMAQNDLILVHSSFPFSSKTEEKKKVGGGGGEEELVGSSKRKSLLKSYANKTSVPLPLSLSGSHANQQKSSQC